MPKQFQNNFRGRGRGTRYNRRGGYYNGGARVNDINIKLPEVITRDEVIKLVQSEMQRREDKATYDSKPDALVDVSNKTWEDFDDELEWLDDQLEDDDEGYYASPQEHDRTIFTDAWDIRPIMDFAASVYKTASIGSVLTSIHNIDVVGFIGYTCALAETYLASNEMISGVNGWTEAQVLGARRTLKEAVIPELIALMFLQLRPKLLPDGTRVILLPHTFTRDRDAQDHEITWHDEHDLTIALRRRVMFVQERNAAVQAAVQFGQNDVTETNWMKLLADEADRVLGEDYYKPNDLNNLAAGAGYFSQMYPVSNRTYELFDHGAPARFENHVWDIWFNYDYAEFCNKCLRRKYIGFGNNSCYKTVKSQELPLTIIDAHGDVLKEGGGTRDRWMPWLVTDTEAHANAIIASIVGQVPRCVVNYNRPKDRHLVRAIARGHRCYELAMGHGNAMTSNTLA